MRILLTAPYVGEIGWELLSWQARVRFLFHQSGSGRLVVLGEPGRSAFYADMPGQYRAVDLSGLPGFAYEDRRATGPRCKPVPAEAIRGALEPIVAPALEELRRRHDQVDLLWPDYAGTIHPCDPACQRFIRFERNFKEVLPAPWVVLVPRTRPVGAPNWPERCWADLARCLEARGVATTRYPPDAEAAIAALSCCDLAVGQSTGGLHLASLCGCPHVVWSGEPQRLWTPWQITNRQRYETFWNPLATPVRFHEVDHPPETEEVADWVARALESIGRRTGSARAKLACRSRWRLKNWLVSRVIRRAFFARCPWRVQRLVRTQWI